MAIASLVLGILSITTCNVVTGIPAIICGHVSRSKIEASRGALGGGGLAIAGLVMGYISIALLALGLMWIAVMGAAFGLSIPAFQKAAAVPTVESVSPRIASACNQ